VAIKSILNILDTVNNDFSSTMGNQNEPPTHRENEEDSVANVELVDESNDLPIENVNEKFELPNNVTDLKKKLRFKSFTGCVTHSLTVIEIRELIRFLGTPAPSRDKKPELIAKALSLGEELITEAIQNNDFTTTQLFPFFQLASRLSHNKAKEPTYRFPSSLNAYLPTNQNNNKSLNLQKKRKRTSNESAGENEKKKLKKDPISNPENLAATLPQGINLSKCGDPFISVNDSQILKIFHLLPDTESTQTKFLLGNLNNETERVCIRSYFHDKARNKYNEEWPSQCHFHLNNNNLMIRNQDFCIEDLTKFVNTDKTNEFQMCHDPYDFKAFTFVIQKLGLIPVKEVAKVVKTKNYDQSYKFVVDSFGKRNKEIEETLQIVSISDQVSQAKIKTPCRGKHCQHITVFDLDVYLSMNLQMPQWKCPICFQPSHIVDIFIDSYFQSIINTLANQGGEVEEVSIHPDGQWKPCIQEKFEYNNIIVPHDIIIIDD